MSSRTALTLELTTPIDDERPVFISGNFCEWYPNMADFQMKRIDAGRFVYDFPIEAKLPDKIEYKYTRGGWNHVELDGYGNTTTNRVAKPKPGILQDHVPYWRNNGKFYSENFMPKVEVIEGFEIPQLKRKRNIHVLLPHNYETSGVSYPVLYMQDAQNLFGQGSSYGNWEIDKRLAVLASQQKGDYIIVAIEHGEEDRFNEYSPYTTPKQGKGSGMKYANFIVRTLKPFIDKMYRTKLERQFTGIGGSSMGGLISIYAGLMYPETIGRLMIFSPSLWVSQKVYFDAIEFFNPLDTKIYLYGGGKEGKYMIPSVEKMQETIEKQGFSTEKLKIKLITNPKGEHAEKDWGAEFPKAIDWLFSVD
jgi:predicted alpha/beta superfamily hydrolase